MTSGGRGMDKLLASPPALGVLFIGKASD
jgi:hypothetical protein